MLQENSESHWTAILYLEKFVALRRFLNENEPCFQIILLQENAKGYLKPTVVILEDLYSKQVILMKVSLIFTLCIDRKPGKSFITSRSVSCKVFLPGKIIHWKEDLLSVFAYCNKTRKNNWTFIVLNPETFVFHGIFFSESELLSWAKVICMFIHCKKIRKIVECYYSIFWEIWLLEMAFQWEWDLYVCYILQENPENH